MAKPQVRLASPSSALLALAFAPFTTANIYRVPEATTTFDFPLDQVYPRPTAGPSPESLRRRQDRTTSGTTALVAPDNVCGYIDGRAGIPFSCVETNANCIFFTAEEDARSTMPGWVACCDAITCGARATCLDRYEVMTQGLCDDECLQQPFTLKCTDATAPYCNTVSFSSDIYDYWCDVIDASTVHTASTTYLGQRNAASWVELDLDADVETSLGLPESIESVVTNSGGGGGGGSLGPAVGPTNSGGRGADQTPSSDSPSSSSSSASSSGSSTPVGAIAGGTVGGVAVLAAIGFGIWFILHRKKKRNQQQQQQYQPPPAAGLPQQMHQAPPPGPPPAVMMNPGQGQPPPPGYYDPKYDYTQTYQQASPPPPPHVPRKPHPQTQTQPQQAPGSPPPGGYFAPPPAGAAATAVSAPDDAVSPSAMSGSNASAHRLSNASPTSPGGGGSGPPGHFGQYGQASPPQQQNAALYEAPGMGDGHHRGQMHELG